MKYLNLEYDELKRKSIIYTDKISKFEVNEESLLKYNIKLNKKQLEKSGVSEDLVRLSVGMEDLDDLLNDINQALRKAIK